MEETLGKRIAAHRKRLHLTQDQLAEKLGVTAQAVSKWENDQSCPDITMLPRLAELFSTTTDALLGREQVYETQVVTEPEKDKYTFKWESGRRGAVGFAIMLLLIGGLKLAAELLHWDVGFWSIAWPSALLVLGLVGLTEKFRFSYIACALLGGYFLVKNLGLIHWDISGGVIFGGLILLFGLCLLVDAVRKPKKHQFRWERHGGRGEKSTSEFVQTEDSFCCEVAFGHENRQVEVSRLTGGDIDCSFGKLNIDLTPCREIEDGCLIDVDCSFGELELAVPRAYRVVSDNDTVFAGVRFVGQPDEACKGVIRMNCDVAFGSVTVHYV